MKTYKQSKGCFISGPHSHPPACAGSRAPEAKRRKPCEGSCALEGVRQKPCAGSRAQEAVLSFKQLKANEQGRAGPSRSVLAFGGDVREEDGAGGRRLAARNLRAPRDCC